MNTYYASILDEKILQEKANTNKKISISLNNIFELNEKEYLSLYAFFLYEACSANFEWHFTGSCYLMLLQERNPERFKSHFLKWTANSKVNEQYIRLKHIDKCLCEIYTIYR